MRTKTLIPIYHQAVVSVEFFTLYYISKDLIKHVYYRSPGTTEHSTSHFPQETEEHPVAGLQE